MERERLRFQKSLQEHQEYLNEKLHKHIHNNDTIGKLMTETMLIELDYIWKIYELDFNGPVCSKEGLI